jgi:hypothetical protein
MALGRAAVDRAVETVAAGAPEPEVEAVLSIWPTFSYSLWPLSRSCAVRGISPGLPGGPLVKRTEKQTRFQAFVYAHAA